MKPTITERDRQLLAMPTLASQLPLEFGSGARWSSALDCICPSCQQRLSNSAVHASVVPLSARLVAVEAVGRCVLCKFIARFRYHLHDDNRITAGDDENWQHWLARPSIFTRVARALRAALPGGG